MSSNFRYEKSLRGYLQYIDGTDEMEDCEKERKVETESEPLSVSVSQTDTKQLDPLIQEFIHFQVCIL